MQVKEIDLALGDGRILHVYDTGPEGGAGGPAIVWHHGTPNIGAPPEPLFPAADQFGVRRVSYDRPGYGGSMPRPGRDIASAAADASGIADALGLAQFAVMGHSGGGPTPWPAARSGPIASSVSCPGPDWPRLAPRDWTGSGACMLSARPNCVPRPRDAQHSECI